MPYWQLYYHLVWATKNRAALITDDVEEPVHHLLRQKMIDLEAIVFALNGMPDHIHVVAAIPPKISVAHFVGQIKAVTATKFNRAFAGAVPLVWQREYGAFSFDGKRLPNYIGYVEHQKEHHQANATIPILERHVGAGPLRLSEGKALYMTENDAWRQELASLTDEPF